MKPEKLAQVEKLIKNDLDHLADLFIAMRDGKILEWRRKDDPNSWEKLPPPHGTLLHIIVKNPECFRIAREAREFTLRWIPGECGWMCDANPPYDSTSSQTIRVREVL